MMSKVDHIYVTYSGPLRLCSWYECSLSDPDTCIFPHKTRSVVAKADAEEIPDRPCNDVIIHVAQFRRLWVFADHTRKHTQNDRVKRSRQLGRTVLT